MKTRLSIATLNAVLLALPVVCPASTYTFTTLDHPLGANTELHGISGNDIVGAYRDAGTNISHGFLAQTPIPEPSALTLAALALLGLAYARRRP